MNNQLTQLVAEYEATNSEETLAVLCDYLEERSDAMVEWWRFGLGRAVSPTQNYGYVPENFLRPRRLGGKRFHQTFTSWSRSATTSLWSNVRCGRSSFWATLSMSPMGRMTTESESWAYDSLPSRTERLRSMARLQSMEASYESNSTMFRTWGTEFVLKDELMKCKPGDTVFCEGVRWNYIGKITQISPLDISLENAVKVFDTPGQTEGEVMANGISDVSECEYVGDRCLSRAGLNVAQWTHKIPKSPT